MRAGAARAAKHPALYRALVAILLVILWQITQALWVSPLFISSPSAVAVRLWNLTSSGFLVPHMVATFSQAAVGFVIGFAAGLVLGYCLGLSRQLGSIGGPFLNFFYSIPRIAIAPLFVIWFGIDFSFKALFVAFVVSFISAISVFGALRQANRTIVDAVWVMGARGFGLFRIAVFPQQVPAIFTAMRITLPLAVASDIVAEFVASNVGLGFIMNNAASVLNTATVLAVVVVLALTITLILAAVSLIERRVLRWQRGLTE